MRIAQMKKNRKFQAHAQENALTKRNENADLGEFYCLAEGT
jgi:hypothetical protein